MAAFKPEALLFVASQPYLSRRRERLLIEGLCRQSPIPAQCIRLEGNGPSLPGTLDAMAAQGRRRILVQPVGIPFSDSISTWLPGALSQWLTTAPDGTDVRLGQDLAHAPHLLQAIAEDAVVRCDQTQAIAGVKPSLGPRGWDDPGQAQEHILICTGPRCHFRGAPRLRTLMRDQLRDAELLDRCQVTEASCLGPCNLGPLAAHYPDGTWYRLESVEDVQALIQTVLVERQPAPQLQVHSMPRRQA